MAIRASISLSQSSQSITGNYSRVSVYVKISWDGGSWDFNNKGSSVTLNGTKYNFTNPDLNPSRTYSGSQTIYSNTFTVYHNADGSKTVSASTVVATATSSGTVSASTSKKLTTIPRATMPTVSPATVEYGADTTISLEPASSAFTHKLYVGADGHISWVLIASDVETTYTWTVPKSYADSYTNADNGLWLMCETYNGSTLIGTKTIKPAFYLKPSSDMVPTLEMVVSDPMGYAEIFGGFVKNQSRFKVNFIETEYKNAGIVTRLITMNGETYADTPSISNVISKTVQTIIGKITDSRGMSASISQIPVVIDWYAPSISRFDVDRANSSGIVQNDGDYAKIIYNIAIAPVNNKNAKTAVISYKEQTATTWTTESITMSGYTASGSVLVPCNTEHTFEFKLTVTDSFTEIKSVVIELGTAFTLLDFNNAGTGMAIGKVSEYADLLEVDLKTQFNKDVEFKTKLIAGRAEIKNDIEVAENANITGNIDIGGLANVGGSQIISSGNNDNGSWVRFYDGTQICRVQKSFSSVSWGSYGSLYIGQQVWPFPKAFVSRDEELTVIVDKFKCSTGAGWGVCPAQTTTAATIDGFDVGDRTGNAIKIAAIAIGRWK